MARAAGAAARALALAFAFPYIGLMLLLTWHGTILRVEQTQNRLTHAPLIPVRDISRDFQVALTAPPADPTPVGAGMEMLAGPLPGTVHLRRGNLYLSTKPGAPFPLCDEAEATAQTALLPLTEAEAAALRLLLAGAWVGPADRGPVTPVLQPGFVLDIGAIAVDLVRARAVAGDDGSVSLVGKSGTLALLPAAQHTRTDEWHLRRLGIRLGDEPVSAADSLHAQQAGHLALRDDAGYFAPPLTVSRADLAWLFQHPALPRAGQHKAEALLIHEADAWLMLDVGMAGAVFGPDGMANAPAVWPDLPPHLSTEAGELFLDTTALRSAPVLEGPHAVFYTAPAANRDEWLLGAMVNLALMQPNLPPGTTLILPRALREAGLDTAGALAASGFGDMAVTEIAAPICRVRDLYWLYRRGDGEVPSWAPRALRDRATAAVPEASAAAPAKRRFYVRQAACEVANAWAVEGHFKRSGFETVDIDGLGMAAQIALFQSAAWIAAVQGPALANLLFCPAGAKVIEFVPQDASPARFAMLASQLSLPHGVMPCMRRDDGASQIDIERLRAMLLLMNARQ